MDNDKVERELTRFTNAVMEEMEKGSQILVTLEKDVKPLLLRLLALPSAGHICFVSFCRAFIKDALIDVMVWLDAGHSDSPLVREIVREGITSRVHKQESSGRDPLVGIFTVGRVRVQICGWLPETCRVEEEVEVRPADEGECFVGADGRAYRRRVVKKLVCGEHEP